MSRLCLTAVLVFLAAGWVYAEATGAPPSKPPPLSLPPIVPLTGSAPETQPAKPAQPAKPSARRASKVPEVQARMELLMVLNAVPGGGKDFAARRRFRERIMLRRGYLLPPWMRSLMAVMRPLASMP